MVIVLLVCDLVEVGLVDVGWVIFGLDLDICYVGLDNFIVVLVFGYEVFRCYLFVLVVVVLVWV